MSGLGGVLGGVNGGLKDGLGSDIGPTAADLEPDAAVPLPLVARIGGTA
jgi:hypothetical protein